MPNGDIVGMFTGRMCLSLMERITTNQTSRAHKKRKIRRDSGFQKCRRGPRDRLIGGGKVETREHLESLLCQRDQKLRRKRKVVIGSPIQRTKNHWIELMKDRIRGEK
jgi:hypothetical protein